MIYRDCFNALCQMFKPIDGLRHDLDPAESTDDRRLTDRHQPGRSLQNILLVDENVLYKQLQRDDSHIWVLRN